MRYNPLALEHLQELRSRDPALAMVLQRVLDDLDLDPPPVIYEAHPLLATAYLVIVSKPATDKQWGIVWHRLHDGVHIAAIERWDDSE